MHQEVGLRLLALGGLPPGFVGPGALFSRRPLVGLALHGGRLLGKLLLPFDRLGFRFRAGAEKEEDGGCNKNRRRGGPSRESVTSHCHSSYGR
jgi:hypothetical protein